MLSATSEQVSLHQLHSDKFLKRISFKQIFKALGCIMSALGRLLRQFTFSEVAGLQEIAFSAGHQAFFPLHISTELILLTVLTQKRTLIKPPGVTHLQQDPSCHESSLL